MTMKNGWIQCSSSLVQVFSLYVFGWIFWANRQDPNEGSELSG